MTGVKYPVGSFIFWCDEYYKVLENYHDHSGKVMDMGKTICNSFYFKAYGEEASLVTDVDKINELNNILQ